MLDHARVREQPMFHLSAKFLPSSEQYISFLDALDSTQG